MGLFSSAKKRVEPYGLLKPDAEHLARLEARGIDVTAPREIELAVCFTSQERAEAASSSLRADRVRHELVPPSHDIPDWTIMVTSRNQALVPDFIRERIDLCRALAETHQGDYEGWVALMTEAEKAAG